MVKWLCMLKKQVYIKLLKKIQRLPLEIVIPAVVLVCGVAVYAIIFLIEKPVSFSYGKATCVNQLTLLPGLHRVSDSTKFTAHTAKQVKIGSVVIAAFSMCFMPQEAPQVGNAKVGVSPWGSIFAQTTFSLTIPEPPVAEAFANKGMPVTKPLSIMLTAPDRVFTYVLKVGDKQAGCQPDDAAIVCSIQDLALEQGTHYNVELVRQFRGKTIGNALQSDITTLSATAVTNTSIKSGEVVYSKPKAIDLQFDKKIVKASATLYRIEGENRTPVETSTQITDQTLHVEITDELPRSAQYDLVTDGVEATDGSSLKEAHKLGFSTSGGPHVVGVSVGHAGVAIGATVVITFDQPLLGAQDISKFVSLTGGAALAGKENNRIFVSLASVPKCGDFSIKFTNDIQSNYEIAGNSAWSFSGRVICHTVGTIGYSSKGRPINAYYFGTGSRFVVYTGAIHGNEYSTKSLMDRWIQDLEANARNIPADKTIVVVPQINPDGVAAGTRVNGRNVDLNRNFATTDWQSDVTDVNNNPFPGGGGPSPTSEPETRAIAALVQQLHPVVVLSYHSVGGVVAGNLAGGSSGFASTYSQFSGYGNVTGHTGDVFEYAISGAAEDWYAQLGVACVLIELGSHSYNQFDRNQKAMWAMVNL
jgi:methionine-rich copper-binding protein CopC